VLGVLGRGGMGVVYKARQLQLDRVVALKMIRAGGHAGPEELARFRREAEAVARLQHPNIVQIHEVGEHDGLPFFSLEFCESGSLADKLDGTPQSPREAARLVETLARAVQAAHERHIVHRDLKPANVLLAADGTPKVTDFGLAKKLDAGDNPTVSGAILGTPSYMAPEQAGGRSKEVGPAADVYALGAILYELLTGRPPFLAATMMDTLARVCADEPVPVRRLQPGVPRDLETVCLKCLEKDPTKRYASARDLAEDLRRFGAGEPVRARPVGVVGRGWRWGRRNPAVAGLLAAVAAALLGGTAAATLFAVRADANARRANTERDRADEEALQARRNLYLAHMQLAERAYDEVNMARVRDLLERQQPERTGGTDLRGFEWYYLWRLSHSELLTLRGHTGWVQCVAFSPDGRRLASASGFEVRVWDTATGAEVRALQGHTGEVLGVAFGPDGRRLASASWDQTVRVWDTATGAEVHALKGHTGGVHGVPTAAAWPASPRTGRCGSGTRPPARRSTPSRGTPTRSVAWPSAPTAAAWPAPRDWRCGSGTRPPARRSTPSRAIPAGSRAWPSAPTAAAWPAPAGMLSGGERCGSGTRPPGNRSSPSGGTPSGSRAWPSAPTASAWPAPPWTRRCNCGRERMPQPKRGRPA
jgi:hypothetical protein